MFNEKFRSWGNLVIIIISVWILVGYWNALQIHGVDEIFKISFGEISVAVGTILLAFFTMQLAYNEVKENQKERELRSIDADLKEIYTPLRYMFYQNPQTEEDTIALTTKEAHMIDTIFETYSYRIPDILIKYWEDNVKGEKTYALPKVIYSDRLKKDFILMIEEQYDLKKERYRELTSTSK